MKLLKHLLRLRVFVLRDFQFDHHQKQTVNEQDNVQPSRMLVLGDGELIDGQPVVPAGSTMTGRDYAEMVSRGQPR